MVVEMIMGFTGTRDGMTPRQKRIFEGIVRRLKPTEFHHGDCIGSDDEAASIVNRLNGEPLDFFTQKVKIVCHPPVDGKYQAFNKFADEYRPNLPYLERNSNIAYECDLLVAAPKEKTEQQRRGTWHTIRQAWKLGKPTIIISP